MAGTSPAMTLLERPSEPDRFYSRLLGPRGMSSPRDTIFALSCGRIPAAIAVVRIFGPRARQFMTGERRERRGGCGDDRFGNRCPL
jgi:hypothetical protein